MMIVAPEFQTARFQEFLDRVTPVAKRISGRRAQPHPMLGKQDLMARALEICLIVWQKYHASKADDDMLRISVSAMDRRLRNEYRSTLAFGEAEVQFVSLSAPAPKSKRNWSNKTMADIIIAPEECTTIRYHAQSTRRWIGPFKRLNTSVYNLDSRPLVPEERFQPLLTDHRLNHDDRAALRELLKPSHATWDRYTQIVVGEWTAEGQPVRTVQCRGVTEALMVGLGWPKAKASKAWLRLSRIAHKIKEVGE